MIEILHGQLKNRQPVDEQAVQDTKGDQGSEPIDPLPSSDTGMPARPSQGFRNVK
jgi:hypothetical protein